MQKPSLFKRQAAAERRRDIGRKSVMVTCFALGLHMLGSGELSRLADLFRLGARAARRIAAFRPQDKPLILELAAQIDKMAAQLDAIVAASDPQPTGINTAKSLQ